MPRPQAVPLNDALVVVPKGGAAPAPQPGRRPEPQAAEKRIALTFRITEGTYEWLRRTAFDARVSQQALVDQALDLLRAERSRG
jgi:hypothetical protein